MARTAKKSIFDVLLEATDVKRKNRESADDFKVRLMEAASEMPDDKYNDLPAEVADCVSDWLRAYNGKDGHDKNTVLEIPGFKEDAPAKGKAKEEEPKRGRERERVTRDEEEEEAEKPKRGRKAKDAEEEEDKPAAKRGRPAAAAKANGKAKAEPKKAAAKADRGERKPRETNRSGSVYKIKEFLIKKPKATVSDVVDAMESAGIECKESTIIGIRSDFRNSLQILNDKGKLQGMPGFD